MGYETYAPDDLTHALEQLVIWTRRVEQIRREQQPRRTPSTGLPPACEGAAAMKIDPPGSVAAPHGTPVCSWCMSPNVSLEVFNFGKTFVCRDCKSIGGRDPSSMNAKPGPKKPESDRPTVSTADFAPQDRPIPAIKLARIVMSVAEMAAMGDGMSIADALSMLARDIAHPLRLGEHG